MDIVISFDFPPHIGGAHLWLYEVYRRWPSEVRVLTRVYSTDRELAQRQQDFDGLDHGALRIARNAVALDEIDLLKWKCVRAFYGHAREIGRLRGKGAARLHALRAFPEGFSGLVHKWMHPGATRLVTYAHGEEILISRTSTQLQWMTSLVYAGSDLIIANSENTRRLVKSLYPRARVVCIHPGVEAASFGVPDEEIRAYRSQWGWPANTVVLSTLARMEPRKNHAMVLRAVAELRQAGLPIGYLCGGEGKEKEALLALASTAGLMPCVRFVGAIPEAEKRLFYCASDIHVMPAIQVGEMIEGFGIVFLEAAAAGVPSVCGDTGGQPEAVRNGETGFVVNGSSLQDVSAALRRLVQDSALRSRMANRCREWAAEHDWSNVTRRTQEEIARALA